MGQQQQTVLRVLTNIPDNNVTTSDGSLTIYSESTIHLNGNGTDVNPYVGSTTSGGNVVFDVNQTNGTLYISMVVPTGATQNIYITRAGTTSLVAATTGDTPNFIGNLSVNVNDVVTVELNGSVSVTYIYFVPTVSPTFKWEYLDLYSSVPIKINRSYAELQDISSKNSDFSLNVQIPGSKKNNAFFESFYDVDVQSYYFNPNARIICNVLINDQSYFNGYLKLKFFFIHKLLKKLFRICDCFYIELINQ